MMSADVRENCVVQSRGKACPHWTVLQAEEANQVPLSERPFCWAHHRHMVWLGIWICLTCQGPRGRR
jgi:hypothetical protein